MAACEVFPDQPCFQRGWWRLTTVGTVSSEVVSAVDEDEELLLLSGDPRSSDTESDGSGTGPNTLGRILVGDLHTGDCRRNRICDSPCWLDLL